VWRPWRRTREFEFDDDFVGDALLREDDLVRTVRSRRRTSGRRPVAVAAPLVAIAALALAWLGQNGKGPLSALQRAGEVDSTDTATLTPSTVDAIAAGVTTTTDYHLTRRTYSAGQCVTWSQDDDRDTRPTRVVPCDQPHLIEMTHRARADGFGAAYPGNAVLDEYVTDRCEPFLREQLATHWDPDGRFYPGAVMPSRESWLDGDRDIWCGIQARTSWFASSGRLDEWTGVAEHQDQSLLIAAGTCVAEVDGTSRAVDCHTPHVYEVTGVATVAPTVTRYPVDSVQWQRAVGDQCARLGTVYLGHPPKRPIASGWLQISAKSWDAGRRVAECMVAKYAGAEPVPVAVPIKSL
jgi:hypothetical protein